MCNKSGGGCSRLRWGRSFYLLVCIERRPNTNVRVFINELTSFFEKALFKNFFLCYQMIVKKLDFSLDEFGLQQHITVPTHKCGGIVDLVITSEEVEVSEPLVNFGTNSDHGFMHFDFFQKH